MAYISPSLDDLLSSLNKVSMVNAEHRDKKIRVHAAQKGTKMRFVNQRGIVCGPECIDPAFSTHKVKDRSVVF
jgi:hypothetical protein